ncbi:hypothetical protein B9Z55_013169 [Caenorhabditis nigoni]|nr:hypothetical protein B9Z55_013169 [Caenorhabditis nigoni]
MRIFVSLILIYPISCTFFLLPAIGTCKQLEYPYQFGSIWIYYYGAAFGLRNSTFYLANIIIWLSLAIIANVTLFYKLEKAKERLITVQRSGISYRAQVSISKTTVVMIIFYMTNGVFILLYLIFYGTTSPMAYSTVIRPFSNELQICMVAWTFYRTHPVFNKALVNTEGASMERREHSRES